MKRSCGTLRINGMPTGPVTTRSRALHRVEYSTPLIPMETPIHSANWNGSHARRGDCLRVNSSCRGFRNGAMASQGGPGPERHFNVVPLGAPAAGAV